MKITFVYPKFDKFLETYPELAEMPAIASTWQFRMPPSMAIPILVNALPDEVEYRVIDQNIEPVDYDDDADLIAISFFTPQASYANEIGDTFMKSGKTVIMGGMHPSMIPDDVAPHCHSICVGEADTLWPVIIDDFRKGELKKTYHPTPPSPEEIVSPKPGIFNVADKYDWHASLVSIIRGCPFGCDWCNVPHYQGDTIRLRPVDTVVKEIQALSGKEFYITDDMVMLNRPRIQRYMVELCERIKDFNVNMFLSGSPAMNNNASFLDAIAAAGTKSIYTVFASDPISTRFYARHPGIWQRTLDLVKRIEDRGMRFFGSFGVGFDICTEDQFDLILEFCEKAHVKTAEFFIATPFPNTTFWNTIKKQDRFLSNDWKYFNCANVVFKPLHTSEERLREGFVTLWREFIKTVDHEVSLTPFHQKIENILKSKEISQKAKGAGASGTARASEYIGGN